MAYLPNLSFARLRTIMLGERLPILTYHSVSNDRVDARTVTPAAFRQQMGLIKTAGYRTLKLEDAISVLKASNSLGKSIVLTFDDGYEDFLTEVAPILDEYDFTATAFVITGRVESASRENSRIIDRRLKVSDLRAVRSLGHSIGSHSVTHPRLKKLSLAEQRAEMEDSRHYLEDALGESISAFAYPYGHSSRRAEAAAREAGYGCACIVGGFWANDSGTDPYVLKRFEVKRRQSLPELRALFQWRIRPPLLRSLWLEKWDGLLARTHDLQPGLLRR